MKDIAVCDGLIQAFPQAWIRPSHHAAKDRTEMVMTSSIDQRFKLKTPYAAIAHRIAQARAKSENARDTL